jgi:hypothetical protein
MLRAVHGAAVQHHGPSRGARRLIALTSFYDARVRALPGVRLARWLGALVALGFAGLMLVLAAAGGRDVLDVIAIRGLEWLAWLAAGVAALGTARDLADADAREGIAALALQRGYGKGELSFARAVATARAIARASGWPALALTVLALLLSSTLELAARRALLGLAVSGYVVLLAIVLAALARWSENLSPRRPRLVLLALVLGPYVVQALWPLVPSVPSVFAGLVPHLVAIGAPLP